MRSLIEVLQLSTQHLENSGIMHARRQAEELIGDTLELTRMQLYLDHDRPLQPSELSKIREALARRAKGEPNPYIRGFVEFHGCQIRVNADVLIPRQETGILVDLIQQELSGVDLVGKIFVDLCSGSGCIGIAIKKRFPDLQVICSDISSKALDVARENAQLAKVEVEFLQGDLLHPFVDRKANYLVCNPPYVSKSEWEELECEVKFEPELALVAGPSGLEFYERIAKEIPPYLTANARVWLEIGYTQGAALSQLFPKGCVKQDWSGKDRFFFFSLENE